ncbi:MAG: T9SS type A sorting domain-containing protein [Saprospiraceae bacterium]|nr:T9SS type A sorting domain-containing protein [Saprospiraceae bacterium]
MAEFLHYALDESLYPISSRSRRLKLAGASLDGIVLYPTSINEALDDESFLFNFAPNPIRTGHPIFIETKSEIAQLLDLRIFDTNGRLVQSWAKEVQAGTSGFRIHPNLSKGAYFLSISNEQGEQKTAKLIVY